MTSEDLDWMDPGFRGGHVTRAFDDWRLEDRYVRAFLGLGLRFAAEGYDATWNAISMRPSDGEGPDLFDLMDEAVDGLTTYQFDDMHLSGVLRDGVTIFDLYFERALAEVLSWQLGVNVPLQESSPRWGHLKRAWRGLAGIDIEARDVEAIRERRHWLVHQRGEFRSDQQRELYDTHQFGLPDQALHLTDNSVYQDLDVLASAIRATDAVAWRLSWGRDKADVDAASEALREVGWTPRA